MDLKTIQELMRQFDTSSLTELKISQDNSLIYFSKQDVKSVELPESTTVVSGGDEAPMIASAPNLSTKTATIIAPIVGVVHLSVNDDQPPFKQVGSRVAVGETVALIEAMKMMTEVKSSVAGIISAIDVANEETVEYGQVLFTITLA